MNTFSVFYVAPIISSDRASGFMSIMPVLMFLRVFPLAIIFEVPGSCPLPFKIPRSFPLCRFRLSASSSIDNTSICEINVFDRPALCIFNLNSRLPNCILGFFRDLLSRGPQFVQRRKLSRPLQFLRIRFPRQLPFPLPLLLQDQ